jgi:hypothetical protein
MQECATMPADVVAVLILGWAAGMLTAVVIAFLSKGR